MQGYTGELCSHSSCFYFCDSIHDKSCLFINVGFCCLLLFKIEILSNYCRFQFLGVQSILTDFNKEQESFSKDKKDDRNGGNAVPPWVGYNEEETMKQQILALSSVRIVSIFLSCCYFYST